MIDGCTTLVLDLGRVAFLVAGYVELLAIRHDNTIEIAKREHNFNFEPKQLCGITKSTNVTGKKQRNEIN